MYPLIVQEKRQRDTAIGDSAFHKLGWHATRVTPKACSPAKVLTRALAAFLPIVGCKAGSPFTHALGGSHAKSLALGNCSVGCSTSWPQGSFGLRSSSLRGSTLGSRAGFFGVLEDERLAMRASRVEVNRWNRAFTMCLPQSACHNEPVCTPGFRS